MTKFSISWKTIKQDLSIYFDRNIPRWMKTKRALEKEVRRRFIEEWKAQWKGFEHAEEQKILYGDPDGRKPDGTIEADSELRGDLIYDFGEKLGEILNSKENNDNGQKKTSCKDSKE